jgi:hypothetical protein
MLPYTTYHIPEPEFNETVLAGKWLWMVVPMQDAETHKDLLQKISLALKADFGTEVFLIHLKQNEAISLASNPGYRPKLVISFGPLPDQLGLWIDMTKPGVCVLEGFTFVLTLSPEALSGNALAKKELWRSMQTFLESQSS